MFTRLVVNLASGSGAGVTTAMYRAQRDEVDVSADPAEVVVAEPPGWELLAVTDRRQTQL